MWDSILDALIDSLKSLPILLIVYILIEFMEHKGEVKFEKLVMKSKKFGPLWGAGLGVIPQCGFSAVMADLFSKKIITIGTLFAVFISTSDEALAIMLSSPKHMPSILVLIASKFLLAIIIGYVLDLIFSKQKLNINPLDHNAHFEHEHSHKHTPEQIIQEQTTGDSTCCKTCALEEKNCEICQHEKLHHHHELENEKTEKKSKIAWDIILQGLLHTLQIFGWILLANILIAIIIQASGGTEALKTFMGIKSWYQPLLCALIGLIPNCAGSVALTELYLNGIISFSSCLGGLCTGAGIGLIILYKNNKDIKDNVLITIGLYLIGAIIGLLFNLFIPFSIIF